jgi:putative FmdB family regulatory protein
MPTYEYVCRNCGHRFDVVQSMHDDPLTVCPECGQAQLRKVFAPPAITFKGSGFYATDSKAAARRDGDANKRDDTSGAPAKDASKERPKEGTRAKEGAKEGEPKGGGEESSSSGSSSGSSEGSSSSGSSATRESSTTKRDPKGGDSS